METNDSEKRVKHLYQLLLEMATGNLSFRNPAGDRDDEIDELARLLNALATQMKKTLIRNGYGHSQQHVRHLLQLTFVLTERFEIKSFSLDVPLLLGRPAEDLIGSKFSALIAAQSQKEWSRIETEAVHPAFHATVQLALSTGNDKLVPYFCTISRLLYSSKILVSAITTSLQGRQVAQDVTPPKRSRRLPEADLMQQVYDYILEHLEQPLPTLKELSKLFGTNEFKLKAGFRHFFNNSIYQFYTEERLKRAHLMIQQSDLPIKAIAMMNGFNYYVNFGKAFKKHFGYAPSSLERNFVKPNGTQDAP